jgi:hypothetical protein
MPPQVRAVIFKGPNMHGDFSLMINRDKYKNTLFILSENIRDMLYSQTGGGGTAQLRLYCYGHVPVDERPQAAGIPTGWTTLGGFTELNPKLKYAIDLAFERILLQLCMWDYQFILYSCDSDDNAMIGAGLFKKSLGEDVVEYISEKIHALPTQLEERKKATSEPLSIDAYKTAQEKIRDTEELWFGDEAKLRVLTAQMKLHISQMSQVARKRQPDQRSHAVKSFRLF